MWVLRELILNEVDLEEFLNLNVLFVRFIWFCEGFDVRVVFFLMFF